MVQTRWLASDPATRRAEVLFLAYSPLWMAAVGLVMASGVLHGWGDAGHLLFGVALAAPLWLAPLAFPDRGYLSKAVLFVTLLSFLQNYFGAVLFFRCFGMRYHFHVSARWILNGTPLFLYFMTVAYFATYFVVLQVVLRAFDTRFPRAPWPARVLIRALLCYATAFAETASMANERLRPYFSYADKRWTLIYGSLGYGTLFFIALPLYISLSQDKQKPLRQVFWEVLGANTLIMVCYEVYLRLWAR